MTALIIGEVFASRPGHAEVLSADLASEAGMATVEQAIQNCTGLGTLGRFWEAT